MALEFPAALSKARHARRISQLELSMELGVSQRHISFVESGRARPSRRLLLAWLHALELPPAPCNEILHLAGFAPHYSSTPLEERGLAEVNFALGQLLEAHDPVPAFVLDADWNLLRRNRGADWLATILLPDLVPSGADQPANLLDWLTRPDGLLRHVANLDEVGPVFLAMLRRQVMAQPTLRSRVDAYEALLRERLGAGAPDSAWTRPTGPLLTTRLTTPYGELAFFSTFTTFGTPLDITLASLRVEHLFPAEAATREILQRWVG